MAASTLPKLKARSINFSELLATLGNVKPFRLFPLEPRTKALGIPQTIGRLVCQQADIRDQNTKIPMKRTCKQRCGHRSLTQQQQLITQQAKVAKKKTKKGRWLWQKVDDTCQPKKNNSKNKKSYIYTNLGKRKSAAETRHRLCLCL